MEIQLSHARLRPWQPDDAPALVRHANNPNVARNLADRFPHPYTEADAEAWLSLIAAPGDDHIWAIEVGGEAAGGIHLRLQQDVHAGAAEIGYWLSETHWGRGLMTEAVTAVTAHGFEHLDLRRIHAEVFARNPASARVLEKCGYTLEGRLRQSVVKGGEVLDGLLYAITRDHWERTQGS